jgi:hypothetical protein
MPGLVGEAAGMPASVIAAVRDEIADSILEQVAPDRAEMVRLACHRLLETHPKHEFPRRLMRKSALELASGPACTPPVR